MRLFRRALPMSETSQLFNDQTFYRTFVRDLARCQSEAIIESPFITTRRTDLLMPILLKARGRGVKVVVNTRNPDEHDSYLKAEAMQAILELQNIGVKVLFTIGHHRKLAIFDRQVLWEGSLNILSQNDSCEIMRRSVSRQLVNQMMKFIGISR